MKIIVIIAILIPARAGGLVTKPVDPSGIESRFREALRLYQIDCALDPTSIEVDHPSYEEGVFLSEWRSRCRSDSCGVIGEAEVSSEGPRFCCNVEYMCRFINIIERVYGVAMNP